MKRGNRYRMVAKLGSGGMAEVFLGVQLGEQALERLVVVKKLLTFADQNAEISRMFIDEAKIIAALNHPNIVQVYDLTYIEEHFNIVMEYVDGESLAYILKSLRTEKKNIPYPVVCRMMEQVCEGLQYAHTIKTPLGEPLNIVHRDIDPRNLMINSNGYLKIIDFGVAKASLQTELTAPGLFKGKLSHLAPDVFKNSTIDHRMDIYSAGLVLFEMTTMRKAFHFPSDEPIAMSIQRIIEEPLDDPCTIKPNIPRRLADIVKKASHKDREQRYQNAEELAEDIRMFARSIGGMATNAEVRAWFNGQFADRLAERRRFENRVLSLVKQKYTSEPLKLHVDIQKYGSRVRNIPAIDRPTIVTKPPKKPPVSLNPMPSLDMEEVLEVPLFTSVDQGTTPVTDNRASAGQMGESARHSVSDFSDIENSAETVYQKHGASPNSAKRIIAAAAISAGFTAILLFVVLMFVRKSDEVLSLNADPHASVARAEPSSSPSAPSSIHAERGALPENTPKPQEQSAEIETAKTVNAATAPIAAIAPVAPEESADPKTEPLFEEQEATSAKSSRKHGKHKWDRRNSQYAFAGEMKADEAVQSLTQPEEKVVQPPAPSAESPAVKEGSSAPTPSPQTAPSLVVEKPAAVAQTPKPVSETKAPTTAVPSPSPSKIKFLSGSGNWSGKEAALRGCTKCHSNHGEETKTPSQWEFFFSRNRHRRYKNLEDYFSDSELKRVKAYLVSKAKEIESNESAKNIAGVK